MIFCKAISGEIELFPLDSWKIEIDYVSIYINQGSYSTFFLIKFFVPNAFDLDILNINIQTKYE